MNVVETQKVLVADDDAINREVLGELLKPEYTVLLARNGEIGRASCRERV